MPPSRFCTTWTWRDGITLPSPRVTSSSSAQLAQAKNDDEEGDDRRTAADERSRAGAESAPARPITKSASARSWPPACDATRPARPDGRQRRAAGHAQVWARIRPAASAFRTSCLGAVGDHPAAVEHDQPLDQRQQRGAVGHQQQGPAGQDLLEALLEPALGAVVHRAGRLVEHQDRRVEQQRAGHRHRLPLAAGQALAALARR